jgi:hypothetical protein
MSPDVRTSVPSLRLPKSSAWSPVLFVLAGVTSCGIELVGKRRLAPQPTKRKANALARRACSQHAEAIGFTLERALAVAEVSHV